MGGHARRFACVCASNQNRSMEAHSLLENHGLNVKSYGTGSSVKLPGPSADQPQVFAFMTPYTRMHNDLQQQNEALYRQNGVLRMLDRNRRIKEAPERFQDTKEKFDVIITFEERVFLAVLDHFNNNPSQTFEITYVVNLEVNDTHSEAATGARSALDLAQRLDALVDLDEQISDALKEYELASNRPMLISVQFY